MMRFVANAFMIAALGAVLSVPVLAVTHTVNQSGLSFDPDDLTVKVGDTVEWVWSGGNHTVTSGGGPDDPEVGMYFDDPLSSSNPTVSFQFDQTGDYPSFCRPHFGLGMTGVVHVLPAVPAEPATWGAVKSLFD